jgi:hypothetical protein
VVVVVVVVVRDEFLPNGRKAEPFSWRGFAPHGRLARQTLSNWGRPKPSTAWISQGHLTIARGASAWIPTHNRTARLTSTTVQHTWRSVKGTKTARHDWSHDNMPHIPLTCLWYRLGSAPRQSATYASSAKLATLPTCLTQALRPVPHAAKQGLLTELK